MGRKFMESAGKILGKSSRFYHNSFELQNYTPMGMYFTRIRNIRTKKDHRGCVYQVNLSLFKNVYRYKI